MKITITPIFDDTLIQDTVASIFELAETCDGDFGLDAETLSAAGYTDEQLFAEAVRTVFADPDGPSKLIQIEGVFGWTTEATA